MQELLTGMALALLIILQWFVIWECIKMKTSVSNNALDLRTEMGNLGSLLDEALDFLADNVPKPSIISDYVQPDMEVKDIILSTIMNRMQMALGGSDNGDQKEQEEWEVHENHPPNIEEESI